MLTLKKIIVLGLIIGALGVVLRMTPIGLNLEENFGLDGLFQFRGILPAPQEVIVVAIDKNSSNKLKFTNSPEKWPRSFHAQLVYKLNASGAKVIAFDVLFNEPREPIHDQAFALSLERSRNTILFENLVRDPVLELEGISRLNIEVETLQPPIPLFAKSATALAPFPLPKVPAKISQFWTYKIGAGDASTIPAVALQLYGLDVYHHFLKLLQKTSIVAIDLPADKNAIIDKRAVADLARRLKMLFVTQPSLAKKMHDQLKEQNFEPGVAKLIGALIDLYDGNKSRYLNFYGPSRTIKTISFSDVLKSTGVTDFTDKIVFVGGSEKNQPMQKDAFHTVYSQDNGVDISGVEIAATAFANLLHRQDIRPLSLPVELIILLLFGLAMSLASRPSSPWIAVTTILIVAAVYLVLVNYAFQHHFRWLPMIIPLLIQMPLALFLALCACYHDIDSQRKKIRIAIGYYLPNDVIDKLINNITLPSAQKQLVQGICLFTDAEKYTSLSEAMDLKELDILMNKYYETIFAPVKRRDGIVSDIIGDAMLAIWATAQLDLTLRKEACLAALEIHSAIATFRYKGVGVPTRIGLHAGEMLLGNVGALNHYEYRAIGDIVNTANRIQALNKRLGTCILVSNEVINGLDGLLTREVGCFLLKGKERTVVLHELVSTFHDATDLQKELCIAFQEGLNLFKKGKWLDALSSFIKIDKKFEDKAAKFYRDECELRLLHTSIDINSATICIDA